MVMTGRGVPRKRRGKDGPKANQKRREITEREQKNDMEGLKDNQTRRESTEGYRRKPSAAWKRRRETKCGMETPKGNQKGQTEG